MERRLCINVGTTTLRPSPPVGSLYLLFCGWDLCNRCDKRRGTLYRWVVVDVMVSTPTNRDACKSWSKLLSETRKEFPLRKENGWTSNLYNCEALNIFFLGLCKRSKGMVVRPCTCLYRAESVELPCVWINTQQPCHGGWWGVGCKGKKRSKENEKE